MKKIVLMGLAIGVMFIGCEQKTDEQKAKAHVDTQVVEQPKNDTIDTLSKVTTTIATATQDVTTAVTQSVVDTTKNVVATAAQEVANQVAVVDGATLYASKCASCHGADGKTPALGKSALITNQSVADITTKIKDYQAGTRNTAGMGAIMKGQVGTLNEKEVEALANHIATLK